MERRTSLKSSLKFAGKTIVITGSGTGIGQAIAKKFALNGANIIIMGRRKEPLDQTSEILSSLINDTAGSSRVRAFPGVDVADETGINEMFKSISKEFGKVDIIINNAGVSGPVKTFTNADFNEFRDCVAIHLTGTFWTSVRSLQIMERGSKIITISTFFSEENRYEQRPYRFRTPYTAAQGAKNRLIEAFAWELVEKGIRSVATNPGPVHSDRIYKTVYPKAAAEFLRISGFQDLTSSEVEKASSKALHLLGESEDFISTGIKEIATEIATFRNKKSLLEVEKLSKVIAEMLVKIQEIAEKVQKNTSNMIIDGEFLTQEEVGEMVLNLCDENISKLINGRVIPNDRLFYPVKPIVGTFVETNSPIDIKGKVIALTITSSEIKDIERLKNLAMALNVSGAKQIVVLTKYDLSELKDFSYQLLNFSDEEIIKKTFNSIRKPFGKIDALVHFTGDYDYNSSLLSLSRVKWDSLVDNFINIPHLITREAVRSMAPEGATEEPAKFKGSKGVIIIVGPDAPVDKKVTGIVRARSEVFRGALRPYTATVNQELDDVLSSYIRLYLILAGNIGGMSPNTDRLQNSMLKLISASPLKGNETIFCIDEARV
ncbi:MAG TPA: SDR family NAD(P)-dependent oxidoreductase [Nitrososphaeraceae archaeon]|nr:SDR family NAD(P)-dependent oxidoreductase [Nitrososphaeraceae archaeon]